MLTFEDNWFKTLIRSPPFLESRVCVQSITIFQIWCFLKSGSPQRECTLNIQNYLDWKGYTNLRGKADLINIPIFSTEIHESLNESYQRADQYICININMC